MASVKNKQSSMYVDFGNGDERYIDFTDPSTSYGVNDASGEPLYSFSPRADKAKKTTSNYIGDNSPTYDNPAKSTQTYNYSGDSDENVSKSDIKEVVDNALMRFNGNNASSNNITLDEMRNILGTNDNQPLTKDDMLEIFETQREYDAEKTRAATQQGKEIREEIRNADRINNERAFDQSKEAAAYNKSLNTYDPISTEALRAGTERVNEASRNHAAAVQSNIDKFHQYNANNRARADAQRQADLARTTAMRENAQQRTYVSKESQKARDFAKEEREATQDYQEEQANLNYARTVQLNVLNSLGNRGSYAYW